MSIIRINTALVQERLLAQTTNALQARLDAFAQTRGYAHILSAASYSGSTIPRFAADAIRAISERDRTWTRAYQLLAEVQAGTRQPLTLEQIMAEIPEPTWDA